MQLVTIILNKVDCLETLLESFAESGIHGATILDSTGMGHTLFDADELRFFATLRILLDPSRQESKTILVLVADDKVKLVSKVVNEVTGGLDQPDTGIMFALPVSYVEGLGPDNAAE